MWNGFHIGNNKAGFMIKEDNYEDKNFEKTVISGYGRNNGCRPSRRMLRR